MTELDQRNQLSLPVIVTPFIEFILLLDIKKISF